MAQEGEDSPNSCGSLGDDSNVADLEQEGWCSSEWTSRPLRADVSDDDGDELDIYESGSESSESNDDRNWTGVGNEYV